MHLRQLKTFLVVARTGNVTRAAAELHLSQSAVSDQLQALEGDLAITLFERSNRGLTLTVAGDTLRTYAAELLALAEDARSAVADAAGAAGATLTIGALETIAAARLSAFIADFSRSHPAISLQVKIAGSGELRRKIEDGEIDLGFAFSNGTRSNRLVSVRIADEPLVLITPPEGASARQPAPTVEDLSSEPFIATENGCVYRHLFDRAFAEAGIARPRLAAEVDSIGTICRLVANGAGNGLVPRLAAAEAVERGDVVEKPWPGGTQRAALHMIWRRRRVQPPALRSLIDAAKVGL